MRTAFLLCGSSQGAQDLTQTALLDLCRAWRRVRRADDVDGYAHRVLINAHRTMARKADRERQAWRRKLSRSKATDGGDRVTVDPVNSRIEITPFKATAWVNRWTGETAKGTKPPAASAALTQAQWIRFLNSPEFQKYADGYLSYVASLPGGYGSAVHG